MLTSSFISLCSFWVLQFRISTGFNLDFEFPVLKQGPPGSLFGYSVAEHQFDKSGGGGLNQRLLIAAPNGTNKFQKTVTSPGTVFICDATSVNTKCEDEVPFDTFGSSRSYNKNKRWLGVSLKSSGINKPVLACAHRHLFQDKYHLLEGVCYSSTGSLKRGEEFTPCAKLNEEAIQAARVASYENYGQCLAGIGVDMVEESKVNNYIIGAVGALRLSGSVFLLEQVKEDDSLKRYEGKVRNADVQAGLMGYSIDHGSFLKKNRKDIAAGAPRSDSNGLVFIFAKEKIANKTDFQLSMKQVLPENKEERQIGSSFGYEVRAVDSNKDGFSELLVGAPFYAERNYPEQGMVFYYKNDGKGKLVLAAKLTSKGVRLHFGTSIANAGDMDYDGYDDVAIGAPHEDNGKGAIYIYRGSANGLSEKWSQKILASQVNSGLMGFGRSIDGGLDLDGNLYKDLLVGAYASDSAVLLRSRPVIKVEARIIFMDKEIDTSKKTLVSGKNTTIVRLRLCVKYTSRSGNIKGPQRVKIKVVADPGTVPRLNFDMTDKNTVETNKVALPKERCSNLKSHLVYREDGTISVYPDISLHLTHELPPDSELKPTPTPGKVTPLDEYAVLEPSDDSTVYSKVLHFSRGCRPCIPDLTITADKNQTIGLGTKTYPFNVTVRNKGPDPAYVVAVSMILPEGISLSEAQVLDTQVQCKEPTKVGKKRKTVCNNVFNEFKKGEEAVVTLILDTQGLSPFSTENEIVVNFTSVNVETKTGHDNVLRVPLTIKANADLALKGAFVTRQEFYGGEIKGESAIRYDDEIGHVVKHRYYVFNYGPDLLPSAVVTVQWPSVAVSGKHLLYLMSIETENAICNTKAGVVNEVNYIQRYANRTRTAASRKGRKGRSRREASSLAEEPKAESNDATKSEPKKTGNADNGGKKDAEVAPATIEDSGTAPAGSAARGQSTKEGKILDCRKKTAKCVLITCEISNFTKGGNAYITLTSRIWNSTFLMDYRGDIVTIVSYASVRVGSNVTYIKDDNLANNAAELYTVIRPDFPSKGAERIAVWKIALAILAGVILLALLIFGLYKVGFFNRRRGGQFKKKKEVDGADDTLLDKKT